MIPKEQQQMQRIQIDGQRRRFRRATLAVTLLAGTALGGYAAGHVTLARAAESQPVNPPAVQTLPQMPDFADLVKQVKPAVVSVTTKLAVAQASDIGPSDQGSSEMRPP